MAERGRCKRRSYSKAFKRRVVAETLEPRASVAAVPRRHGLNASMVLLWRGDPRFGHHRGAAAFLPVKVKPAEVPVISEGSRPCGAGEIETALALGHRLMLSGTFDVDLVLRLARGLAASWPPAWGRRPDAKSAVPSGKIS